MARRWNRCASSVTMPRWCNCICAWVQASVFARSNAIGSRCLSARSSTSSRDEAASVQNATRAVAPRGIRTCRRRLKIGSSTAPTVLESGQPSAMAAGERMVCPRPRKRARSVSNCTSPELSPSTTARCAAHTSGSAAERRRRVARIAPRSGTNSVSTKSAAKAGCATSSGCRARTISA